MIDTNVVEFVIACIVCCLIILDVEYNIVVFLSMGSLIFAYSVLLQQKLKGALKSVGCERVNMKPMSVPTEAAVSIVHVGIVLDGDANELGRVDE